MHFALWGFLYQMFGNSCDTMKTVLQGKMLSQVAILMLTCTSFGCANASSGECNVKGISCIPVLRSHQ